MILVDSSVWIDHLNRGDPTLGVLLAGGRVLGHPFVLGEILLGSLRNRELVADVLGKLPQAVRAEDGEVDRFIEHHRLFGIGIGLVDAHLLAATMLGSAKLWTRDRRVDSVARTLGISAELSH